MHNNFIDLDFVKDECLAVLKDDMALFGLQNGMRTNVFFSYDKILSAGPRYSFRADGKIAVGKDILDLTIIGFAPGDGTGSHQDYKIEGVPLNHTPRNKSGFAELFVPLGTAHDGFFLRNVTSLEAITLEDNTLKKYATLTTDASTYAGMMLSDGARPILPFSVSAMALTFMETYGNPHAIVSPKVSVGGVYSYPTNWVQFGAFIPIKDNELGHAIISYVGTAPKRIVK